MQSDQRIGRGGFGNDAIVFEISTATFSASI
jgi:hypothetical protein